MARSVVACAVLLVLAGCRATPPPAAAHSRDIQLSRDSHRLDGTVAPSATFADILASHEIEPGHAQAFIDAVEPVFSSRRLRAHHAYSLERTLRGLVREFIYRIDADRFLKVAGPRASDAGFRVEIAAYRKDRALVAVRGAIDRERSSLVAAIGAAGEDVALAIAIANLFAGDIDFNHDLQPGDGSEVVFERVIREGEQAEYGDILAASFTNGGATHTAFRFEVPGGKPSYYDAQGRSLKRFFLASPLKFEPRVTSRFSYRRLHPILGIRRPHLGVDFGAPRGAPVVSIADGTVVSAGYNGGGGNTVTVRHGGSYESRYLHLSSFARGVRAGARVSQGQIIGRVGSTGLSTGAHLHYELKRHGAHVNPIAEHRRHPPGEPIPGAHVNAFQQKRDELRTRFVSAVPADGAKVTAP